MKRPAVRFTPEAARLLSRLHPEIKRTIRAAIRELIKHPLLGDDLQDELTGFKSYKPRRYRIIYKLQEEKNTIDVYFVGHRRDVYEQFMRLLRKPNQNK